MCSQVRTQQRTALRQTGKKKISLSVVSKRNGTLGLFCTMQAHRQPLLIVASNTQRNHIIQRNRNDLRLSRVAAPPYRNLIFQPLGIQPISYSETAIVCRQQLIPHFLLPHFPNRVAKHIYQLYKTKSR